MSAKPNLLVVGDYNRKDFIDLFISCKEDFNFYFIEFASSKEVKNTYYKSYGKNIFWKQYSDAFSLLDNIRPSKVVFFFIETYNHVALNVACKEKGIQTCHLEHGIRDYRRSEAIELANAQRKKKKVDRLRIILNNPITKIKTQLFFWRTLSKSQGNTKSFLRNYYTVRSENSILQTFKIVNSPYRIADVYITFSSSIFKAHQIADHLNADQKVFFIGIPYFDKWAKFQTAENIENIILFIDQAFAKQKLLGWDYAFKETFVNNLVESCQTSGYKLFVKVHPLENAYAWNKAQEQNKLKVVIDQEFENLTKRAKVIIGFYSTLLMPLAAMPHTTVFTLEVHPVQGIFPSDFLINSGVAHAIFNIEELPAALSKVNELHRQQHERKAAFIKDWLYKLDGNAGKRLRDVLIHHQS